MSEELVKLIEQLIEHHYGDKPRLTSILDGLKQGRMPYSPDQKYVDELISKRLFKHEPDEGGRKYYDDKQIPDDSSQSEDDYSLLILKNRLAKGEITTEEFHALKRTLIENTSLKKLKVETRKENGKTCFICNRELGKSDIKVRQEDIILAKISIPEGMSADNRICTKCFSSLKENLKGTKDISQYTKSRGWTLGFSIGLGLIGFSGMGHLYIGKNAKALGILMLSWTVIGVGISSTSIRMGSEFGYYTPPFFGLAFIMAIGWFILYLWQIYDSNKLCKQYNEYIIQYHQVPWFW